MRRLIGMGGHLDPSLSGAYANSKIGAPSYPEATTIAQAFVKAAPERMVWGSDWPHPGEQAKSPLPNDALLFDLLAVWAPDEATRTRILVANPETLYGFAKARQENAMSQRFMSLHSVFLIGIALLSVLVAAAARAEPPKLPVPAVDQTAIAQRGYFYIGGKYVGEPGKEIMQGQIYVEVLAPRDVRRPYPLVLIHGAAQTATNWMGTPDGRKGWAEYFVEQGYVVYMIDQLQARPLRRASCRRRRTRMFTAANEEFQFTAIETAGTWPQAKKHTQWPGEGPNKGGRGRSAVRCVLCDAAWRPSCPTRRPSSATRTLAPRFSTRSGRRSC